MGNRRGRAVARESLANLDQPSDTPAVPDPRDQLDLSTPAATPGAEPAQPAGQPRPFLSLWFRCSGQYARAYRQRDGSCYIGHCPKCAQAVRFPIGPGGTGERSFTVSCAD